jgi:hypothetical protein
VSAPVSIREFARAVLPSGSQDGVLCMVRGYFDDSGTHGGSGVVLMAGVFGHENQWDYFCDLWAKKLADPSPGKLPLARFHMAECQSADGDFLGWKRHETDFLVHELTDIILKTGIYGLAGGVERKAYDELMVGAHRRLLGDAETFCIINCFIKVIAWAKLFAPGHDIAMIFDDRPHKRIDVQKIHKVYEDVKNREGGSMIASITFANSSKVLPLQAADLFAWQYYRDELDILAGRINKQRLRRGQIARLIKGKRFRTEFCDRNGIIRMVTNENVTDPDRLAMYLAQNDFG